MTNQRLQDATREACTDDRHGKPSPGSGRHKTIDRNKVRQLTQQGRTAEQIAEQLHCSTSSINQIRKQLGITNPRHTLTTEKRVLIEAAIRDGWSQAEICRTHHVDPETMRRHYPDAKWDLEQRLEHLRTLRIGRTEHWGGQQTHRRAA